MKTVSISFSYKIERDVTTKQLPAENEIEIEKSIFSDSSLLQSCNAALSSLFFNFLTNVFLKNKSFMTSFLGKFFLSVDVS